MESLKKYFKLLCFVFFTFFMLGFGGEKVFAEEVTKGDYWLNPDYYNGEFGSLYKKIGDEWAFCLDSNYSVDTTVTLIEDTAVLTAPGEGYKSDYKERIKQIFTKAYQFGLGTSGNHNVIIGDKTYTISEEQLYAVTQIAIWQAAHGESNSGVTYAYKNYINNDTLRAIYKEITVYDKIEYKVNLLIEDTVLEEDSTNPDYLISKEIVIDSNAPANTEFDLKFGGLISVNGKDWHENKKSVKAGDKVKVKVAKSSVTADRNFPLLVTSSEFITDASVKLYQAEGNHQNLTVGEPLKNTIKNEIYISASYDSSKKVTVYKKNEDHEKIAGARLRLYKKINNSSDSENNGEFYSSLDGTEFTLETGVEYCVEELEAPSGYLVNSNPACKTFDDSTTDLSITLSNVKAKYRFKKVDEKGNPMSGVEICIYNFVKTNVSNETNKPYLCATTDSRGYLSENVQSDYYAGDGYYYFEENVDIEDKSTYYIQEKPVAGYENTAFSMSDDNADFTLSMTKFVTSKQTADLLSVDSTKLGTNELEIVITNKRSIKISKTNLGNGEEIKDAKMVLYDASAKDEGSADALGKEKAAYVKKDEWVSNGTPHLFEGIEPGHHYILNEVVAPKGYVRLETDIEFSVDEEGNITIHSKQQEVTSPDKNYLVVGNGLSVPNTGISLLNKIAIGGLMVFIGYEVIKIYRKRTA